MPSRDTRQGTFIKENFGSIWPVHLSGFTSLLIQLRKQFDGDLDLALVLAVIGGRTRPERWMPMLDDLGEMTHVNETDGNQRQINIQSLADYTGIPRETVRRKLTALIDRGWVTRGLDGRLEATREAASDLQEATEGTITYLASILVAFEAVNEMSAAREERS